LKYPGEKTQAHRLLPNESFFKDIEKNMPEEPKSGLIKMKTAGLNCGNN
jgi:hypothetical protein